jgi:hypothetical protein
MSPGAPFIWMIVNVHSVMMKHSPGEGSLTELELCFWWVAAAAPMQTRSNGVPWRSSLDLSDCTCPQGRVLAHRLHPTCAFGCTTPHLTPASCFGCYLEPAYHPLSWSPGPSCSLSFLQVIYTFLFMATGAALAQVFSDYTLRVSQPHVLGLPFHSPCYSSLKSICSSVWLSESSVLPRSWLERLFGSGLACLCCVFSPPYHH